MNYKLRFPTPALSERLAAVQQANHIWDSIDKTNKMVIPLRYSFTRGFSEGLAVVEKGHYKETAQSASEETEKTVNPVRSNAIQEKGLPILKS